MPTNEKELKDVVENMIEEIMPSLSTEKQEETDLACNICYKSYADYASLIKHKKRHKAQPRQSHVCDICKKSFKERAKLKHHYNSDHGFSEAPDARFECDQCGKVYKTQAGLNKHKSRLHSDSTEANTKPNTEPETEISNEEHDVVGRYCRAALFTGLLLMSFNKARKAGDGERIMRYYKYLMLLYDITGKNKYRLYNLYTLLQVKVLLPDALAFNIVHNRFVNTIGGPNTNKEMDRTVEHANKSAKKDIKQFNGKVTSDSIKRSATSFQATQRVVTAFDTHSGLKKQSSKRTEKDVSEDTKALAKQFIKQKLFKKTPGRKYKCFPQFPKDIFDMTDIRSLKHWIKDKYNGFRRGHLFTQFNTEAETDDDSSDSDTSDEDENDDI